MNVWGPGHRQIGIDTYIHTHIHTYLHMTASNSPSACPTMEALSPFVGFGGLQPVP